MALIQVVLYQENYMKPALLVIDVQKDFYKISKTTAQSLDDAIETINAAIDLFRDKNLPIICIQHLDESDRLVPGSDGFRVPEKVKLLLSDISIHKTYGNAFNQTSLMDKLREFGVDTVILTGFCAEYCVLSTYRGALDVDLTPIMLRDALASTNLEHIQFVERISDVVSLGALKKLLEDI